MASSTTDAPKAITTSSTPTLPTGGPAATAVSASKKGVDAPDVARKRAVEPAIAGDAAEEGATPAVKRRRTGIDAAVTSKAGGKAKATTAKPPITAKSKKIAEIKSDSDSDSGSDSDSDSESDGGSGSDNGGSELATKSKPGNTAAGVKAEIAEVVPMAKSAEVAPVAKSAEVAPVAKSAEVAPVAKSAEVAPVLKGEGEKENVVPKLKENGAAKMAAAAAPYAAVTEILRHPKRRLNDAVFDKLVPLILRDERPSYDATADDDGRVLVISPVNLHVVMQRYARRGDVSPENVHKLLGISRAQVDRADAVAIVIHGPHTEEAIQASILYEDTVVQNYHWSLACWFRDIRGETFHYDSLYPTNNERCGEVLSVLRALKVLPVEVTSYVVPPFYPQQTEGWECGYAALIALTILAHGPTPGPITDDDVDHTYQQFFSSLSAEGGSPPLFVKRLLALVAREDYAL